MRIVDPAQLNRESPLEPVLTAAIPPFVIRSLDHAMRDVDQFETPGPAKVAVLQLDAGVTVAVVYHEVQNLLEVLAPLGESIEEALIEVIDVLRIPSPSVEWVREGVSLSRIYQRTSMSRPRQVLVLERSLLAQGLVRELLEAQGYTVQLASSWNAFADLLATVTPDVVLLDADIPDVDASDVLALVTSRLMDIPVVMISSFVEAGEPKGPAYHRIGTPVGHDDLLEIVSSLANGDLTRR